jgi:phosphinothricin acetyltransferase
VTLRLRSAVSRDLPRLTEIYNWYVQNSFATFDEVPATAETRRVWFGTFDTSGPHKLLVAEVDGVVCGYACSSRYRSHPAFSATVESTVYLANELRGQGLGA